MSELVDRVDAYDRIVGPGPVERSEALRNRWLHRIATLVCRDGEGRILVHRRPDDSTLFPGRYNWMLGGAARSGETYAQAAARELTEELGVRAPVRRVLTFLCHGAISPYWRGLHETVVDCTAVAPDPSEIAWHAWLTEAELHRAVADADRPFVPDGIEALDRYSRGRARIRPGS
ncbi:NUDIX domain-containing protein [Streptomyces sp. DSM 42041]|uniref:NUDIX domain-containing protein n=1 Tax=Streptomyces hazeniae TaxID=3075538 RepID=A0ABU2NW32_9ACTN|nr:NUDIX domain-containing protein [Streptomyces sp. DSM 42041]MDT0379818.1 NUDIX domain-containing protein [Streptomyces sp. DSM 42041]